MAMLESQYRDSQGTFRPAGIVEALPCEMLDAFRHPGQDLRVASVDVVGQTVYVSRKNVVGVEMETNEIVFDTEKEAQTFAKGLAIVADGRSYYVNDTSWLPGSQFLPMGTPVEFLGANMVRCGGQTLLAVSYDQKAGEVRFEGDGRLRITLDPASVVIGAVIRRLSGLKTGNRTVTITTDRGTLRLGHEQGCCENICLLDVTGNPRDLVGKTIRSAATTFSKNGVETFYNFRTDGDDLYLRFGDANDSSRYGHEVTVTWTENPTEG